MAKYTFVEFLAACEGEEFDNIEESWMDWAKMFVKNMPTVLQDEFHGGGCTNEAYSCLICSYQTTLEDYSEYTFNESEWRKENEIQ